MADKDILEKVLLSWGDVFADCWNTLACGGRQVLDGAGLLPAPTESFYRRGYKLHSQFSDVSFFRMEGGKIRAQYIIGNQTQARRKLVLRKASYQGGAYRAQLESGMPVYPVAALLLDWSHKRGRIPLSLKRLLEADGAASEDLRLVDEVNLAVYYMKNLPQDVRRRFTSDMGFVADFLSEGGFERRSNQKILHPQALCEMMHALTGDNRFTDLAGELILRQKQGKEIIMCEYIDLLEKKGEARGIKKGEARGIKKGEKRLALLIQILLEEEKFDDIALATSDSSKRQDLYRAYGI